MVVARRKGLRGVAAVLLTAGFVASGMGVANAAPLVPDFAAAKGGAHGAAQGCDEHKKPKGSAATAAAKKPAKAAPKPKVSLSSQPYVGKAVTAKAQHFGAKASLAYQWLADGAPIDGAKAVTFTPTIAEAGKRLSVQVTKVKAAQASGKGVKTASTKSASTVTVSKASKPVLLGIVTAPDVTVLGQGEVGRLLIAVTDVAAWNPEGVTLSYQWYRNNKAIKGATSAEYEVTKADAGKKVSVKVTGAAAQYKSASTKSAAVKVAKAAGAGAPTGIDKVACDVANLVTRAAAVLRSVRV